MRPNLSDTVTISPNLRFSEVAGELVLLDLPSETFFSLDEVGTHIWKLLRQHSSLQIVHETLLKEFDVESARLERDLLRHVGELVDAGLVTTDAGDAAAS
jgi:hypothetical protein